MRVLIRYFFRGVRILLAPVMLMYQTRAVVQVLSGQDGGWPANQRGEGRLSLLDACRASGWIALCGLAALLAAATRELWEETGLLLGAPDPRAETIAAPQGWRGYLATGHLPDGDALRFVFRAITPPGRPRRFDARFFMADAERLANDPDDFSSAEDELSHLQWVPLDEARGFDMPFITEVVLAEIGAILKGEAQPGVPFFNNTGEISRFERL